MYYKKTFSLAAIAVALCASTNQSAAQTTASTNLQVVINSILSISVNNNSVTLTFNELEDYQNGVTTPMTSHLTITSILPYEVSLVADAGSLTATGTNDDEIAASAIRVEAPSSTNNDALPGKTLSAISSLSTTAATLISGSYAVAAPADVTYSVPQAKVATDILGKAPDTYTVALTYSISNP